LIFDRFRKRTKDESRLEPERSVADPAAESTEFLTGDPAIDRRSLQLLLDTMAEVGSTMELDKLLVDLVDKSIELTQAERGFLLLYDGETGDDAAVSVRIARAEGGRDLSIETTYSTSVAKKVLTTQKPLVNIVQSSQEALDLGQSVYDLKLRAVMCVPLAARDTRTGVIYVDSKAERKEFTRRDLAFFAALGQQLAVSIENARLYGESLERARLAKELEVAQQIQAQLMPEARGLPPGIEVETWYRAAETASGDTFDIVPLDNDELAVLLGDVSGHGIGPALIAHSVQSALSSYLEVIPDLGEVTRRLNHRFAEAIDAGSFMSICLVRLHQDDKSPSGRSLSYVNAGHSCSWLVTADGVHDLETSGPAIGMLPGHGYASTVVETLAEGDLLFLCSDGLTEARNSERDMLGEAKVKEVLAAAHGKKAAEVIELVRGLMDQHVGDEPFEDDVMLLALRG
jgi:sigma-B regulation protein RsbU (phosphoserine phosphatase)